MDRIKRLLIANRGEIAVRIIRACRELGIETVAIYSEADTRARHVTLADRAVLVGGARSQDSYLRIPVIVDAARAAGADAIHPGYGFLSQNADFADACEAAGLIFAGPTPAAIRAMGSKIEARLLMQKAGVPIVPGETPADQSDESLGRSIARVGLPAMIKASAGGGGKGMRLVADPAETANAIQAARREALAAFGDGTLYIEKRIERPRHIEVQVMGDRAGNVVHVFERECSVQRRHQKVVEESPAPSIDQALRSAITSAAVQAANAIAYRGAGTIEFLVDGTSGTFHFLEMNTRLQVEHAVTEAVVGVDLVHAQLAVAAGAPLPWPQASLTQRGHAIEARIYAEDPSAGFLPQAGRLLLYREPQIPGVRIDSGVAEGDDVSVHYDPLLAKVIAAAETREAAIDRLTSALRSFPVLGLRTNIPFLLRVLAHPAFRTGHIDTEWLDRETTNLAQSHPGAIPPHVRAAIDAHRSGPAPALATGWDPWSGASATGPRTTSAVEAIGPGTYRVVSHDTAELVYVAAAGPTAWAFWNGEVHVDGDSASPARPRRVARDSSGASQSLTAPMPGTVAKILVGPGDRVKKGDTLVILEAMKMELPIRALDDGVVVSVGCREGELVQADGLLVTLG